MTRAEDPAVRSAIMRAVKSRDTTPERKVRALLRPLAPGYRLHRTDVPGKPDIAWVGRKRALFVHGCFWHGRRNPTPTIGRRRSPAIARGTLPT